MNTTSPNQIKAFDVEKIEKAIPFSRLSKSWCSFYHYKGPFPFPPKPRITVNNESREWTDLQSGVSGTGPISLTAYVLGVTIDEAARRLVDFARVSMNIPTSCFEVKA